MPTMSSLSQLESVLDAQYDDREFKRGEIYYVDLEDIGYGSRFIQTKTRPGLIIQNDVGNSHSQTLIIALLTTSAKKPYPFQYSFTLNDRPSTIMFEQIMTIDKFRMQDKIGQLTYEELKVAESRLMYSLQLNRMSFENLEDFDFISSVSKRTKIGESIYYEIQFIFERSCNVLIHIGIEVLQQFNKDITKDTDFSELKNMFDNCKGLHWLATNSKI